MAIDIFDQLEQNYQQQSGTASADPVSQFEQNYQQITQNVPTINADWFGDSEQLTPEQRRLDESNYASAFGVQPSAKEHAIGQAVANLPASIARGVMNTPRVVKQLVQDIPYGISNLYHAPGDIYDVGTDALNLARQELFGSVFTPSGADYGRLERTLKGIGSTGAMIAGGELLGPILGGATGLIGFEKANQLTGAEPATPIEEDIGQFGENVGTLGALKYAGQAGGKVLKAGADTVKSIPQMANALDRRSIGTRASDYGSKSETRTIESPDGVPETFLKKSLNDLLENEKLGPSRNPAVLSKVVSTEQTKLNSAIDNLIDSYDRNAQAPITAKFPTAQEYISSGQVPAHEIPSYVKTLGEIESAINQVGGGKLRFLQEQKKTLGKSYDPANKVKSGFERALYHDLKTTIEGAVPEIKGLNAELAKYIVTEPIINRALKAQENRSPLSNLASAVYTTGGVGGPTIVGTMLGGPVGTAIGAVLGLGTKALASPTGQSMVARGVRRVGRAAESPINLIDSLAKAITKKRGPGSGTSGSGISQVFTAPEIKPVSSFDNIPRLNPKEMTANEAALQEAAIKKLQTNGKVMIDEYLKANTDPQTGNIHINTDLARPLIMKGAPSVSTHEAASALAKEAGKAVIADPNVPNLAIVSGGPGAGKSTATGRMKNRGIFDKIIKSEKQGSELIDEMLANGKTPEFHFVYLDPIIALERAWARAIGALGDKTDLGRAVPLENFAEHAIDSARAAIDIVNKYAGASDIPISLYDNSGASPRRISLENLKDLVYNNSREGTPSRLAEKLKDLYETTKQNTPEGKRPEVDKLYREFVRSGSPSAAAESSQSGTLRSRGRERGADNASANRGRGGSQKKPSQYPSRYPVVQNPNKNESAAALKPSYQKEAGNSRLMKAVFTSEKKGKMRGIKEVEKEIDADPYYSALYETESGRNPNAKNPESSASGGFQFIKDTAEKLKLDDPFDLEKSFEAVKKLTEDHAAKFGSHPATLYAAHYLGEPLLKKWQAGKVLTDNEAGIIRSFKSKALPRFLKILNSKGGVIQV